MLSVTKRPWLWVLGLLLLAALVHASPAGRRPFWSSDEARQALLAQDILDRGRWIVPELRGSLYLNKPQLYFWSVALVSLPAGRVTELTSAIPSVVSALAGIAGVVAIGRLVWGWPAGLLAGLVLTTSLRYFDMGHRVVPDAMLAAWMVWALYWLLRARHAGFPLGAVAAFYGCVAGALFTKGPPAFALLAAAAVAVGATGGVATLGRLRPLLGLAVLGVATLAWIVPYHLESRGAFGDQVVRGHYLTWFFHGGAAPRLGNLSIALRDFLPWSVLLAGAAVWWRRAPDTARTQIALWALTLWVLLGVSGTFRARYLLPVYPALALLVAEFVTRAGAQGGRAAIRMTSIAAAALALGLAVLMLSPLVDLVAGENRIYVPDAWAERALLAGLVAAGGGALLVATRRGAYAGGAAALGLALAGVLLVQGVRYPGRFVEEFDVRPVAAAATAHLANGGVVIGHPDLRLSYDFYLRRPVVEVTTPAQLVPRLAAPAPHAVITTRERWDDLAASAPGWRVLGAGVVAGREMVAVGRAR